MARLQHAPPRGGGFVGECLPAGAGPAMSLDSASMSSRGVLAGAVGVGEEGAVDGFGELSFEESEGFVAAVAGVASALVVVAAWAGADGLDVGGEMDGVVELAVAVA